MRSLDAGAVTRAYARWAPVYDWTFGAISRRGRHLAVERIDSLGCERVLELGVGTGLSLPLYRTPRQVIGIDYSAAMLDQAAHHITTASIPVKLARMDAAQLAFPDASFDAVAAMYVMTVVPDAAAAMREIVRVLKPGGTAIIVNHFSQDHGLRGAAERWLARYSTQLGWHPVFPVERVLHPKLGLKTRTDLPPFGLFSLLELQRAGEKTREI
jgi:phosphatidylethanolamine/phosphatidyl-N-methylethanolamine N-methyltransferase